MILTLFCRSTMMLFGDRSKCAMLCLFKKRKAYAIFQARARKVITDAVQRDLCILSKVCPSIQSIIIPTLTSKCSWTVWQYLGKQMFCLVPLRLDRICFYQRSFYLACTFNLLAGILIATFWRILFWSKALELQSYAQSSIICSQKFLELQYVNSMSIAVNTMSFLQQESEMSFSLFLSSLEMVMVLNIKEAHQEVVIMERLSAAFLWIMGSDNGGGVLQSVIPFSYFCWSEACLSLTY